MPMEIATWCVRVRRWRLMPKKPPREIERFHMAMLDHYGHSTFGLTGRRDPAGPLFDLGPGKRLYHAGDTALAMDM